LPPYQIEKFLGVTFELYQKPYAPHGGIRFFDLFMYNSLTELLMRRRSKVFGGKMIGAVDIGGTKIAIGIVNRLGEVLVRQEYPTEAKLGPEYALNRIVSWFTTYQETKQDSIDGVGIACTGPVFPESGKIGDLEFLPGWSGFNIVESMSDMLKVDVALENDADAAALGEWAWGLGRDSNNLVVVTVGTGIGVGLILNGVLYRGVKGSHPEIGHHFIDPDGPECSCGGRGCWESLASGPAMEKWAQMQDIGRNHRLNAGMTARFTAKELCQMAEKGEPLAVSAVNRTAEYLAIGISNIVTFLCPEIVVITGGLMASGHLFYPTIQSKVMEVCGYVPAKLTQIKVVHPDNNTVLRGAAQAYNELYTQKRQA
jgi:glucokinase